MKKKIYLILLCAALGLKSFGQTLPVGTPLLEDYYRRQQLQGKLDTTVSFSIRPLSNAILQKENIYDPYGTLSGSKSKLYTKNRQGYLQLLPITWDNQFVSDYPYGWNDGSMIPAVGFQTRLAAGLAFKYKFVSIQLRPEFVAAQNKAYQGFLGQSETEWRVWYQYMNNTDMPERFGVGAYTKIFAGQSHIKFTFGPVSFGASTENIWWGPGMRNSLLLSNTAPGFLHGTIHTARPIKTPIGSFEAQLVGGRLEASGYPPRILTGNPSEYDQYYWPKEDNWRYLSGAIVSYQPKWLPGLTLGVSRSEIIDGKNLGKGLGAYIPLFGSLGKSSSYNPETGVVGADEKPSDAYISFFSRWVMPASKAEVYFEWGRNDASWNFRDFMVQINHTRAYTFGVRKLFDFDYVKSGDQLQLWAEVTQMERPKTASLREGPTWYLHHVSRNNYTNLGQPVGAGLGLGSNVQMLNISWLRDFKQLGIQFERLVHNNDFFYDNIKDPRRNWVDLSVGFLGEWDYKNFLFTGKMQVIRALNYQYQLDELPDLQNYWKFKEYDRFNFVFNIGMMYRF